MATSAKSIEMVRNLQEELNLRLGLTGASALLSSTLTFEALSAEVSDGSTLYPVLLIGDNVATHATCRIVVKPIEWALSRDVLGLASQVYTPHEILWGIEDVSGGGAEPLTALQKAVIMGVLVSRGARVTLFHSATGDSFDVADFVNSNRLGVFEPSVKYPMIQSQ